MTISDKSLYDKQIELYVKQMFQFSLGPVQEFVGISFTRDNLNCFRVN